MMRGIDAAALAACGRGARVFASPLFDTAVPACSDKTTSCCSPKLLAVDLNNRTTGAERFILTTTAARLEPLADCTGTQGPVH